MIADRINHYLASHDTTVNECVLAEVGALAQHIFKRQFMTEPDTTAGTLRLSACGKCPRQLAYHYHNFPQNGKTIDPRARMVFLYGDLIEMMVLELAKLAGCDIESSGLSQAGVGLSVDDHFILGHPDGTYQGRLVEIKSLTTYAYRDFEQGIISDIYRAQINAYLEASLLEQCILIGVNKDSGVLGELLIDREPGIVAGVRHNLAQVMRSRPDLLPPAPERLDPNENGIYPWECRYCAFHGTCRANAGLVLRGSRYVLKEKEGLWPTLSTHVSPH